MGACPFQTVGYGETAKEAYRNACEDANAENGHQDGYSGDIQTTQGFREVELTEGEDLRAKVEETIDDYDKHGPCGCIRLAEGKYLFYGWAAE